MLLFNSKMTKNLIIINDREKKRIKYLYNILVDSLNHTFFVDPIFEIIII
jgi:hypothetical protein